MRSRGRLLAALLLLACVKFWLVSHDEIVAQPIRHDQLRYAEMASSLMELRWLGRYNELTLTREPGFPLWIWAVHLTGVPLRLANEGLLVCAAIAFALSLRAAGLPVWVALGSYVVSIFNPYSIYWSTVLRTDTLYTPMLMAALAGVVLALVAPTSRRRIRFAAFCGIAFAILWLTRPERVLILSYLGAAGVIAACRTRSSGKPRRPAMAAAVVTLVPLAVVLSSDVAVRTLNWAAYGAFVLSDIWAPGFRAAHRALLGVRPEHPRQYVSVTADVRRRAYAVSSAFRQLEPFLEGQVGTHYMEYGCKDVHVCDDIGDGWIHWALRDAAAAAGHYRTFDEAERYYRRVADEINAARDDGRLPAQRVVVDFLNPDPMTYLPHLPASLARVMRVFAADPLVPAVDQPDVPAATRALFTRIANRREALTVQQVRGVRGWAFGFDDPVTRVSLRDGPGKELGWTPPHVERPEVAARLAAAGVSGVPSRLGFSLTFVPESFDDRRRAVQLAIIRRSGAETLVPLSRGEVVGAPLAYAVESLIGNEPAGRAQQRAQRFLRALLGPAVVGLTRVGVVALLILVVCRRAVCLRDPAYAVLGLLALVVATRVLLFALIDASGFPGNQSRYEYPVMSLYLSGTLLLIRQAARAAIDRYRQARAPQPAGAAADGSFQQADRRL